MANKENKYADNAAGPITSIRNASTVISAVRQPPTILTGIKAVVTRL